MSQSTSQKSTLIMSDKWYTVLKHVAAVGLPALSTLYFAVASIWNIPDTKEVVGTIAAINTFVGALVGVSNVKYNNSDVKYAGDIQVLETPEKKTFALSLNSDPEDLAQMNEATFKITPLPPEHQESNPPQLGV